MNFLTMQQELSSRLRAYDTSVAADLTDLKRWLNMAQQYICGKQIWPFRFAEEILQTVPDYTTGTVTISAAGTTATFSATITDSKTDQYIQFASSQDWYKITAHTAGTDTATISPAAISANTAATYTIRKLLYTTTTPLIQIVDMKQLVTPTQVVSVSPLQADFMLPLYYDAGNPYYYVMSSPNSSGTPQFSFMQSPSTVMNINIRGLKVLSDLSADADISIIPVPWHDAIINIAAYYGFQGLDDTRANIELQVGEARIADMNRVYTVDIGRHRVMRSPLDDTNYGLQYGLPPTFGPYVN